MEPICLCKVTLNFEQIPGWSFSPFQYLLFIFWPNCFHISGFLLSFYHLNRLLAIINNNSISIFQDSFCALFLQLSSSLKYSGQQTLVMEQEQILHENTFSVLNKANKIGIKANMLAIYNPNNSCTPPWSYNCQAKVPSSPAARQNKKSKKNQKRKKRE